MGIKKIDEIMARDLIGRDLEKLVFAGKLGRRDCSVSFMRGKRGYACRYRTMYTRGCGGKCAYWAPLDALFSDKLDIQNDIMEKQLEEENLPENEKKGVGAELGMVENRWKSERCHRVDRDEAFVDIARAGRHSVRATDRDE